MKEEGGVGEGKDKGRGTDKGKREDEKEIYLGRTGIARKAKIN